MVVQIPPTEPPLGATGHFTTAWLEYLQSLTDITSAAGVVDGSDAPAGDVGEYLTASGAGVAMANAAFRTVASLALGAGDWEAHGHIQFLPAVTTQPQALFAGLSTAPGAITGNYQQFTLPFTVGAGQRIAAPLWRFSLAAAATIYLVAFTNFTVSTMAADGGLQVRRMR